MDENTTAAPSTAGTAVPGIDPAGFPATDPAGDPAGDTGAGDVGADLARAVEELRDLDTEPVHHHAARYADVHTRLQDALSDTDRGDANPR